MNVQAKSARLERGEDAITLVQGRWNGYSPTEFVTPEWVISAWQHLPELGEPIVAAVEDESGWCALALTATSAAQGDGFTLAGAPLGDEHDVVASGAADADRLVPYLVDALERLAERGHVIDLGALAAAGPLTRELADRPDSWALDREPAPVIYTDAARVNVTGHRRRLRQLSRRGETVFITVDGGRLTSDEVSGFVSRRLASWSRRERIGDLPRVERLASFPAFLGAAAGGLAGRDRARLLAVEVDGHRIAESLHIGPSRDPLMYMINYDPDFAKLSPGRVLLEHTLLQLGAETSRLRTGRGDEAYKIAAGARLDYVVNGRSTLGGR
jgi:CelD/BcsL family acetyltransferase involved in cellulose biosynthesis